MSAQTSYNQKMSHGVAGGLYDLTNHTVDTRTNEETDGKVRFGLGVVAGTAAGKQVKLPTSGSAKKDFEGVVLNSHIHEMDYKGDVSLRVNETVGVYKDETVSLNVQPTVSADLKSLPEGDRASKSIKSYGDFPVTTVDVRKGIRADRLYYAGEWYECVGSFYYEHTPLGHWKSLYVRVSEADDSDEPPTEVTAK